MPVSSASRNSWRLKPSDMPKNTAVNSDTMKLVRMSNRIAASMAPTDVGTMYSGTSAPDEADSKSRGATRSPRRMRAAWTTTMVARATARFGFPLPPLNSYIKREETHHDDHHETASRVGRLRAQGVGLVVHLLLCLAQRIQALHDVGGHHLVFPHDLRFLDDLSLDGKHVLGRLVPPRRFRFVDKHIGHDNGVQKFVGRVKAGRVERGSSLSLAVIAT